MRTLLAIAVFFMLIQAGCSGGGLTYPAHTPDEAKRTPVIRFAGEGDTPSRNAPYTVNVWVQPIWYPGEM